MKNKTLLRKLQDLMQYDESEKSRQRDAIRNVLKKLKKRENKLIAKREKATSDEKRKLLRREINIIHKRRKKGLAALKEIAKTPVDFDQG